MLKVFRSPFSTPRAGALSLAQLQGKKQNQHQPLSLTAPGGEGSSSTACTAGEWAGAGCSLSSSQSLQGRDMSQALWGLLSRSTPCPGHLSATRVTAWTREAVTSFCPTEQIPSVCSRDKQLPPTKPPEQAAGYSRGHDLGH